MATAEGERSDSFRTVMRALARRLQDSAWTIVYKSLILIHIMIREGDGNTCIKYLSTHIDILDIKIGKGGKFIANGGDLNQVYTYAHYIAIRAKEFANTGHDFIKDSKKPFGSWSSNDKSSILRELTVEKGLLRTTESVQKQVDALLNCRFRESEVNNDLVVLSFRMLTTDLIALYQCLNEGILNILEHFFDLSKTDADRAFDIYEHFTKETKKVIEFLRVAKHLESVTKLRVPTIKHAQTSLTDSLREYLDDSDFEINRRQYLAEKEFANKTKRGKTQQSNEDVPVAAPATAPTPVSSAKPEQVPLPAQLDQQQFIQAQFEAQQQMLQQQQLQMQQQQLQQQQIVAQAQAQAQAQMIQAQATANANVNVLTGGLAHQSTGFNPFTSMNTFSVQPIQQQMNMASTVPMNLQTPTQTTTGTFIQTPMAQPRVLSNNFTGNGFGNAHNNINDNTNFQSPNRQNSTMSSNNPFSNSRFSSNSTTTPFTTQEEQESQAQRQRESLSKIAPSHTGTNPFRLETSTTGTQYHAQGLPPVQELQPQPTAGGLENLPTIPVFPETQRHNYQQQLQQQAAQNLQNQVMQNNIAQNPFSQQATGVINQAQQTGNMGGFNFVNCTGAAAAAPVYQQGLPGQLPGQIPGQFQQTQGQVQGQMQFQAQGQNQPLQMQYSSVYNGPNLLG